MGGFEFIGKNVNRENVVWSKSVRGWKSEWRGYNERSYDRERVGRWGSGGGWRGDDVLEKPSMSDTSFGGSVDGDESDELMVL